MNDPTMDKRKVLLMAVGVSDRWNPLPWFRQLKTKLPLARLLGLAVPTRTSRGVVEAWKREPRAKIGLYGWRGTANEFFGATLGEAYFKLRDAFECGPYDPFFFPPDGAVSSEVLGMLRNGDERVNLPPLAIVGNARDILTMPKGTKVLPFVGDARIGIGDMSVGIFLSERTRLEDFERSLVGSTGIYTFCDPGPNVIETNPDAVEDLEVVQYVPTNN